MLLTNLFYKEQQPQHHQGETGEGQEDEHQVEGYQPSSPGGHRHEGLHPRAEAQRPERKEDPDLPNEHQHATVIGAQEDVQPRREQPGQEDSGSGDGTGSPQTAAISNLNPDPNLLSLPSLNEVNNSELPKQDSWVVEVSASVEVKEFDEDGKTLPKLPGDNRVLSVSLMKDQAGAYSIKKDEGFVSPKNKKPKRSQVTP